jgi:hypothetical protein
MLFEHTTRDYSHSSSSHRGEHLSQFGLHKRRWCTPRTASVHSYAAAMQPCTTDRGRGCSLSKQTSMGGAWRQHTLHRRPNCAVPTDRQVRSTGGEAATHCPVPRGAGASHAGSTWSEGMCAHGSGPQEGVLTKGYHPARLNHRPYTGPPLRWCCRWWAGCSTQQSGACWVLGWGAEHGRP